LSLTAEALKKLETKADFYFHKQTPQEVLKHFDVEYGTGLLKNEVKRRQAKHGLNELEKEEETSLWERIKEQFEDLLARILLLAAFISFAIAFTGDGEEGLAAYVEPFVILLILVLNALVAIYQDQDADNALEALKDMQATECTVLRDGGWKRIESK
jgi:Ca2+-transporting ATPase